MTLTPEHETAIREMPCPACDNGNRISPVHLHNIHDVDGRVADWAEGILAELDRVREERDGIAKRFAETVDYLITKELATLVAERDALAVEVRRLLRRREDLAAAFDKEHAKVSRLTTERDQLRAQLAEARPPAGSSGNPVVYTCDECGESRHYCTCEPTR